jgi:hypothetical protein
MYPEGRNAFNILKGKATRKRPLGRPKGRWEYNIRMDLVKIGSDTKNWVNSAQNRDNWEPL